MQIQICDFVQMGKMLLKLVVEPTQNIISSVKIEMLACFPTIRNMITLKFHIYVNEGVFLLSKLSENKCLKNMGSP